MKKENLKKIQTCEKKQKILLIQFGEDQKTRVHFNNRKIQGIDEKENRQTQIRSYKFSAKKIDFPFVGFSDKIFFSGFSCLIFLISHFSFFFIYFY